MIENFLKAKHWQLFLLNFGIPILFQFILWGSMISVVSSGNEANFELMFKYLKIFPLFVIFYLGVFFGWLYSIGVGLNKTIPNGLKLKVRKFRIFLLIPICYIILISIFIVPIIDSSRDIVSLPNIAILTIIVLLHLFSMFCILYCFYFVAKTIKTAELQRNVRFGDYAGEFFLIWFYPIGVWFLQPKINKIIRE